MNINQIFANEYDQFYQNKRKEKIKKEIESLRNGLKSNDPKSIIELDRLISFEPENSLEERIEGFIKFNDFALSLYSGKNKRSGEKYQNIFLNDFIKKHTQIEINFIKAKDYIKFKGHDITFLIFNKANNYSSNSIQWIEEQKPNRPTIILIGGGYTLQGGNNSILNKLKNNTNIHNLTIFSIDEFVKWIKES